jgi:hypothetical protein
MPIPKFPIRRLVWYLAFLSSPFLAKRTWIQVPFRSIIIMFRTIIPQASSRFMACRAVVVGNRPMMGWGNMATLPLRRTIATWMPSSFTTQYPRPLATTRMVPNIPSSCGMIRWSSSSLSATEIQKRLDEFQNLFVEARLCIEDVHESEGTKYFDEDAQSAKDAVDEAIQAFEQLIQDIDDPNEKNRVLRGNGLKVEQLKGELELALKGGHDH